MKNYSKVLALLLSFVLLVMPGTGVVSAASVTSVTVGETVLSQTEAAEIDLAQKTIDIALDSAVDESVLEENVTLAAVERGDALHLTGNDTTNSGHSWAANFVYNFPTSITSGSVTLSFDMKYTTDRYPTFYFYADENGTDQSYGAIGIDETYLQHGNSTMTGTSNLQLTQSAKGRWCEVVLTIDLATEQYSLTVDGEPLANNMTLANASKVTTPNLKYFKFDFRSLYDSTTKEGAPVDFYLKDFEISHSAPAGTEPVVFDTDISEVEIGDKPDFFTYGTAILGTTSPKATFQKETVLISSETVTMARSYDADTNTYTLTNESDWDATKEHVLTIGEAVAGTVQEYSFFARNLTGAGSFKLDGIAATNGAALADGGYASVGAEGIDLTFTDAVDTATLSGIKLQKRSIDRVLHLVVPNTAWGSRYFMTIVPSELGTSTTEGVYTFTTSVIVDTKDYEGGVNETNTTYFEVTGDDNGTERILSTIKPRYNRVSYTYANGTSSVTQDTNIASGYGLPKGAWRDITYTFDLTNDTYSCTATDPLTGETQKWADTSMRNYPFKEFRFGVYNYSNATSNPMDISWKNIKMTYAADSDSVPTTVLEIDTDTASMATVNSLLGVYEKSATGRTLDFNNEYESAPAPVAYETAYNPTTQTVTVLPTRAFEYLGKYILTVPTSVLSDDAVALDKETVLNFKGVYSDSLYSAASGFMEAATSADLTEISDTFTGDITGWADITNYSGSTTDAVVIVALYKGGQLVDADVVDVPDIGAGATVTGANGTVTIASDKAGAGYQAAVYVWESLDNMLPVTVKTTTR